MWKPGSKSKFGVWTVLSCDCKAEISAWCETTLNKHILGKSHFLEKELESVIRAFVIETLLWLSLTCLYLLWQRGSCPGHTFLHHISEASPSSCPIFKVNEYKWHVQAIEFWLWQFCMNFNCNAENLMSCPISRRYNLYFSITLLQVNDSSLYKGHTACY